ncbi:hypothetical protein BJ138DRAFT_1162296 [Hygrophoropsis aurantiaca]|uniref:Uncharacterized protein n=1 Tax=Hygrophoropsis aurantiaca TaxID=72124 RepID=A0ACB8A0A5_9AGAM|nr:hypothetical protein BJ138DRAFT_1162296 [Hygrophoropsis aurantiaca]
MVFPRIGLNRLNIDRCHLLRNRRARLPKQLIFVMYTTSTHSTLKHHDLPSASNHKTTTVEYGAPITLYDIPCNVPDHPWSPNTMKTRYTLNYKSIPFTTTWAEYPDIEPTMRALGAQPTAGNVSGPTAAKDIRRPTPTPLYTLPVIHDHYTGAIVSDSLAIAEYLERTYPNRTTIFPALDAAGASLSFDEPASSALPIGHNAKSPPSDVNVTSLFVTKAFHRAFLRTMAPTVHYASFRAAEMLNERSRTFYARTREERWGVRWGGFSQESDKLTSKSDGLRTKAPGGDLNQSTNGQINETGKRSSWEAREWAKLERAWSIVARWYDEAARARGCIDNPLAPNSASLFLFGAHPSYADFIVAARLKWCQLAFSDPGAGYGSEVANNLHTTSHNGFAGAKTAGFGARGGLSETGGDTGDDCGWTSMASWNGGRWGELVRTLDKYLV